jgi:hypothetical protein
VSRTGSSARPVLSAGAPEEILTPDLQIRSLYQAIDVRAKSQELCARTRAHKSGASNLFSEREATMGPYVLVEGMNN